MRTLLFVLGGTMVRNPNGTWRLARYTDIDPRYGCVGEGYSRAVAAAYLWKDMADTVVIVTGGKCGFSEPNAPFLWIVLRRKLIGAGCSSLGD